MRGSRGGGGGGRCPDPHPPTTENHKATKPAFNVGPLSARWWPTYSGIWILSPLINSTKTVKVGPPLKILWIRTWIIIRNAFLLCILKKIIWALKHDFVACEQQRCRCYDIKPVRKEEGKSYWKIPLCDDDATRENNAHN